MSDNSQETDSGNNPPDPIDPIRQRVDDVIDDLVSRRVMPQDRGRLRDAVDKADRPRSGKDGANDAFGRVLGRKP